MDRATAETLNTTQQVLRLLMLSLAAASQADMAILGDLLERAATDQSLTEEARAMLADLAAGATGMAAHGRLKS